MKSLIKYPLIAIFVITAGFFIAPNPSFAISKEEMIQNILKQIGLLQVQLAQLQNTPDASSEWCYTFEGNIKFGDLNKKVSSLQTALTKEGFNISDAELSARDSQSRGYFGESTASAVVGFQEKYKDEILTPNGLQHGTGFVGKATRTKLNQLYGCGKSSSSSVSSSNYSSPSITFISPNHTNHYALGDIMKIRWEIKNLGKSKTNFHLCREADYNNHSNCGEILSANQLSESEFEWKIEKDSRYYGADPTFPGKYKIISMTYYGTDKSELDGSSEEFTIGDSSLPFNPSVTIISPNGGEKIIAGQRYQIRYKTSGISSEQHMVIALANINSDEIARVGEKNITQGVNVTVPPNNANARYIQSNFSGFPDVTNTGVYYWQVPSNIPTGSNYYLYIGEGVKMGATDFSDHAFSIVSNSSSSSSSSQPFITVLSPNSGVADGKTIIEMKGSGFIPNSTVIFRSPSNPNGFSIDARSVSNDGKTLTFFLPDGSPGTYSVTVSNLNGTADSNSVPFTISTSLSEWKTYRNDKYGFEIKYPERYKISENTSNDIFDFNVTFINQDVKLPDNSDALPPMVTVRYSKTGNMNWNELIYKNFGSETQIKLLEKNPLEIKDLPVIDPVKFIVEPVLFLPSGYAFRKNEYSIFIFTSMDTNEESKTNLEKMIKTFKFTR